MGKARRERTNGTLQPGRHVTKEGHFTQPLRGLPLRRCRPCLHSPQVSAHRVERPPVAHGLADRIRGLVHDLDGLDYLGDKVRVAQLGHLHLGARDEIGDGEVRLGVAELRPDSEPGCPENALHHACLARPILIEPTANDIALAVAVRQKIGAILQPTEFLLQIDAPPPDR
jgi:hypothetical protein